MYASYSQESSTYIFFACSKYLYKYEEQAQKIFMFPVNLGKSKLSQNLTAAICLGVDCLFDSTERIEQSCRFGKSTFVYPHNY